MVAPQLFETDPSKEFLRGDESSWAKNKPVKVDAILSRTVAEYGNSPAMRVKREGVTTTWNYIEYETDVKKVARSLMALDLKAHDTTLIMGFNAPEWSLACVGTIYASGMSAGVYASNQIPAVEYQVSHSRARIVFCEDEKQAAKFLDIRDRGVGNLKHIVVWGGTKPEKPDVHSWEEFMKLGADVDDAALKERGEATTPGSACSLIYTSGTTGPPKAVMINNDSLTFVCRQLAIDCDCVRGNERVMGYLPLSHIAAQILDIFFMIECAGMCYFAPPTVMRGMVPVLQEALPTVFFGVPRVWEKIEEKLEDKLNEAVGMKKSISDWARGIGERSTEAYCSDKVGYPWGFSVAQMLVFNKIKTQLGLQHCKRFFTGAAPTKLSTIDFFASLYMPILEIYGMSECTGPETRNCPGNAKLGSTCGNAPQDDAHELKIENPDEYGEGEVIWKGRHLMMGYMYNPEETAKAIDGEGYLHSGDIGKIDADGFLSITGRKKELIITAGGENIPPVLIENEIKKALSAVSNAMVVGDQRKYLTVVLTLKNLPDAATGLPTDNLDGPALRVPDTTAKTLAEVQECSVYKAYIEAGIKQANDAATSNVCFLFQLLSGWGHVPCLQPPSVVTVCMAKGSLGL